MAIVDNNTPGELWYDIPSLSGYQFSSEFRVRSFKDCTWKRGESPLGWHVIRVGSVCGYAAFKVIGGNGKKKYKFISHIVAELAYGFMRGDANGTRTYVVRHYDDDRTNDYASNLAVGTQKDNARDAIRNGRVQPPAQWNARRFTPDDVRRIRDRSARGGTIAEIATEFRSPQSTILKIVQRRTWKTVV